MNMKRNLGLIEAISSDLIHYHRFRMAERAGLQAALLREERSNALPDPVRIELIRAAMLDTKRNEFNTNLTVEEVIAPLRSGVDIRVVSLADEVMADPELWVHPPPPRPARALCL